MSRSDDEHSFPRPLLPTASDFVSSTLALPDRFRHATFDTYDARTPSQEEAVTVARRVVATVRRSPTWVEWAKQILGTSSSRSLRGLYLVGPAGTGKTHLLAAMYQALTPAISCAFLHSSTLFRQTEHPDRFAHRLADQHSVCCLDEVEIDDPANEMRLLKVMNTLAERNVRLLATSNVEPGQYLSAQFRESRFERFLEREFRAQYRVVPVRGVDYRRNGNVERSGHGWIGPPDRTHPTMHRTYEETDGPARWWSFDELRQAATEISHPQLIDELSALDHLFVEAITIHDTDDALRLLRVIDALYLRADAPVLYFTAEQPPDAWFDAEQQAGVARAVAEKFDRTVSRIYALCTLHEPNPDTQG